MTVSCSCVAGLPVPNRPPPTPLTTLFRDAHSTASEYHAPLSVSEKLSSPVTAGLPAMR